MPSSTNNKPFQYCQYCGSKFTNEQFPQYCPNCQNTTYRNPIPVAVAIVPVENQGVLCIQREIEPHKGQWALPGGFVDYGESWQHAICREVKEETGINLQDLTKIKLQQANSTPDARLILLFAITEAISKQELSNFQQNEEVRALKAISQPIDLAFPLHTSALKSYFSQFEKL